MKKYQYQIIRYIHDHFTGEYINVGVVVYSKEHRFLASMTSNRYQRVTQMFPEADGKWIVSLLVNFNQQIQRISRDLVTLFTPPETLDSITSSILIQDNGSIQFTESKLAVDVSLEAAIDDLFHTLVVKYIPKSKSKQTLLDEDVWRKMYKSHFEKYGLEKRLKQHDVKVPRDLITFQRSWKNEVWHCYEPLSFVLQEKDSIKDKVYKWAGRINGLQQANEPLHLTLLTSISPKHKDLMAFVEEYLHVNTDNLTVDIVTDDHAENLAREIYREMEIHDMKN